MAVVAGFTMHGSGFWFRNSDSSGPYVFDGTEMWLASVASVISSGSLVGAAFASGIVANAVASATLPAVAGKRNYVTGFEITGSGATVGSVAVATLSGVIGGPLPYVVAAPVGILLPVAPLIVAFDPPLPAAAANQAITLSLPALGLGNLNASVILHGYQL